MLKSSTEDIISLPPSPPPRHYHVALNPLEHRQVHHPSTTTTTVTNTTNDDDPIVRMVIPEVTRFLPTSDNDRSSHHHNVTTTNTVALTANHASSLRSIRCTLQEPSMTAVTTSNHVTAANHRRLPDQITLHDALRCSNFPNLITSNGCTGINHDFLSPYYEDCHAFRDRQPLTDQQRRRRCRSLPEILDEAMDIVEATLISTVTDHFDDIRHHDHGDDTRSSSMLLLRPGVVQPNEIMSLQQRHRSDAWRRYRNHRSNIRTTTGRRSTNQNGHHASGQQEQQ